MIPNATLTKLWNGDVDVDGSTIEVALFDDSQSYTADPDTHEFVSNVLDGGTTAQEYSDTNYSRQTLANAAGSQDDTDDEGVFDGDDVTFPSLGSSNGDTVQGAVIYQSVTDDTDSHVLRVVESGDSTDLPKATNGEDFTLSWNSEGIATISTP